MPVAKPERRGGLGRGLSSLLPGSYEAPAPAAPAPEGQRLTVQVEDIEEVPVSSRPASRVVVSEEGADTVLSEPIPREVSAVVPALVREAAETRTGSAAEDDR